MCKRSQGINLVITKKKTTNQFIHCGELSPKTAVHMSQKNSALLNLKVRHFSEGSLTISWEKGNAHLNIPCQLWECISLQEFLHCSWLQRFHYKDYSWLQGWPDISSSSPSRAATSWASLAKYQRWAPVHDIRRCWYWCSPISKLCLYWKYYRWEGCRCSRISKLSQH